MKKLTKLDKARVVIQALYNLPELPAADDRLVVKRSQIKAESLDWSYEKALVILEQRGTRKPEVKAASRNADPNVVRRNRIAKAIHRLYRNDGLVHEDDVTDALTDLRHLCAEKKWDFDDLRYRSAGHHYEESKEVK